MEKSEPNTKTHILTTGIQVVAVKGFHNMGLAELLKTAQVPKGSFYHYFKSKEEFGEAMLKHYSFLYLSALDHQLAQPNMSEYERLMGFGEILFATQGYHSPENKHKRCLVVKLTAEVADLSEPMRQALFEITDNVIKRLIAVIERGKQEKSIGDIDAVEVANHLYQLWLGANLINRLRRDDSSLKAALTLTSNLLRP